MEQIRTALADVAFERDPALKHLKLHSVVSAIFCTRGIERVVVGGAAVQFYIEGACEPAKATLALSLAPPGRVGSWVAFRHTVPRGVSHFATRPDVGLTENDLIQPESGQKPGPSALPSAPWHAWCLHVVCEHRDPDLPTSRPARA